MSDTDARAIARILSRGGYTYRSSRELFKAARRAAGLKRERERRGTVERLTDDEAERFIEAAYDAGGQTGLMAWVLLETGLRVAEFAALRVEDVSFQERIITVQAGKGGNRREVPIRKDMAQMLRVHVQDRQAGPLFLSARGGAFGVRRIQQLVRELAVSAGITKPVHPHLLRHTCAMVLRRRGVSVDVLREIFGHETVGRTGLFYGTDSARVLESSTAA